MQKELPSNQYCLLIETAKEDKLRGKGGGLAKYIIVISFLDRRSFFQDPDAHVIYLLPENLTTSRGLTGQVN